MHLCLMHLHAVIDCFGAFAHKKPFYGWMSQHVPCCDTRPHCRLGPGNFGKGYFGLGSVGLNTNIANPGARANKLK
eukprot:6174542-Amphidinium_carterae.1